MLLASLLFCADVRADEGYRRGVLLPRPHMPLRVEPGQRVWAEVRTASGLTPPPGVQSERALRGFAARACARGLALSAPAELCTRLLVRDVRPRSAHGFEYRVELLVPAGFAWGRYDLELRFPGGAERVLDGLEVTRALAPASHVSALRGGLVITAAIDQPALLRVHLGGPIALEGAELESFPRYADDGGFARGSVGILRVAAGREARVRALVATPTPTLRRPLQVLEAGSPLLLSAPADWHERRVFWRLAADREARGRAASTRYHVPGRQHIEGLAIDRSGLVQRLELPIEVRPRLPGSCSSVPGAHAPSALGLLLVVLSWKLAAGLRAFLGRRNTRRRP